MNAAVATSNYVFKEDSFGVQGHHLQHFKPGVALVIPMKNFASRYNILKTDVIRHIYV